jgi:hypothetical protein
MIYTKGDGGGWAFGHHARGSSNSDRGGFGFLGSGDGLSYYYIGPAYNAATMYIFSGSNFSSVGIGTSALTYSTANRGTLEINGADNSIVALKIGNSPAGYMYADGADLTLLAASRAMTLTTNGASALKLGTNSATRVTIDGTSGLMNASNNITLNNTSPTLYLQDSNNRSAMIHVNDNTFYVLRGDGNNSLSWATVGGVWPLQINLENNDVSIGGGLFLSGGLALTRDPVYTRVYRADGGVGIYVGGSDAGNYYDNNVHYFRDRSSGVTMTVDSVNAQVGIGTTSPQKKLDVVVSVNDFASVGTAQMSPTQWAGIHFGYREGNTSYRKSAIVFERTDLTEPNAQGKVHILNGPQSGAGSATLSDARLTIGEAGHVSASLNITAQGNGLRMGSVYTPDNDYMGLRAASQTGTNDYMIISGKTSDTSTYISAGAGATVYVRGGGNSSTHQLAVSPSSAYFEGNLGIRTSAPATFFDIGANGNVSAGNISLGARSNNVLKYTAVTSTQYAISSEPEGFMLIGSNADTSTNVVRIGGGIDEVNAATSIIFFTAANATTRTGTTRMTINSSGQVGIGVSPSYALHVSGDIYATDNITAYSDRRVKKDIITIDNALAKVNSLRGVYYNRIDDEKNLRNVGVIAQEVLEVVPELVSYAEDIDQYSVKYGNITAVLIEAIKELSAKVDNLQKQLGDR